MKKYSKLRLTAIIITAVLTVLTIAFIWGNSMLAKTQSAQASGEVYSSLKAVLDAVFGKDAITSWEFRKLAHGAEFLILGLEINLLYMLIGRFNYIKVLECCGIGIAVAIIDELIQLASQRGALVTDVLIDVGAIIVSCLIFVLIYSIILKRKEKDEKSCK